MQPTPSRRAQGPVASAPQPGSHTTGLSNAGRPGDSHGRFAADQSPDERGGTSDTLDEVARRERDAMRPRLRDELGREPTEEELDEWLRRHTEGY